jgi:hypothetical protein
MVMMIIPEDVFADWRDKKFVIADSVLNDKSGYLIILTDFGFWATHMQDLENWCKDNDGEIQGMTLNLLTEQSLAAFLLKWT